ncbi:MULTISPECIES: DUF3168 domain-containing protein [Alphaproteobacteria]|uniref:DUF3168 domain-containing protein n=2 Tax=Alphaproteobacteria TaxID=28211 RepID=A0A512HG67_9HYPH|nr:MULTISPECIES: DUF3168 domain-containing protein [Alphaproteobacteria]GEO84380.1 hypothetical protein RNA01_13120 [Ciceribacter naphthalenivorans]GLR22343.1 hypothetical protein GCM10007920_21300 [Ciceribacter naphthalenivorans]GLT05199.1 hypothetical protein GCM10007926_21300 [Sphingomonas psychrolutea]
MTSPVNEFLAAVQARLSADAGLVALVGASGLRDRRADRLDLPALVLGTVETRDYSTASEAGVEILMTLEAWSATSRREAEAIAAKARVVLGDAPPMLAGAVLVSLRHRRTVSRREVKTGFFAAEMAFRAVVELTVE